VPSSIEPAYFARGNSQTGFQTDYTADSCCYRTFGNHCQDHESCMKILRWIRTGREALHELFRSLCIYMPERHLGRRNRESSLPVCAFRERSFADTTACVCAS